MWCDECTYLVNTDQLQRDRSRVLSAMTSLWEMPPSPVRRKWMWYHSNVAQRRFPRLLSLRQRTLGATVPSGRSVVSCHPSSIHWSCAVVFAPGTGRHPERSPELLQVLHSLSMSGWRRSHHPTPWLEPITRNNNDGQLALYRQRVLEMASKGLELRWREKGR